MQQAKEVVSELGDKFIHDIPFVDGAQPTTADPLQAYLNRTWRPTVSIIGADGLPATAVAGNVLRPETTVRVGVRLPPTLSGATALKVVTEVR